MTTVTKYLLFVIHLLYSLCGWYGCTIFSPSILKFSYILIAIYIYVFLHFQDKSYIFLIIMEIWKFLTVHHYKIIVVVELAHLRMGI